MGGGNSDPDTVASFGAEWARYDQSALGGEEWRRIFATYFDIFPFEALPADAVGFDMGCGSGRWARGVAPRVGHLHCLDPSAKALAMAGKALAEMDNVSFHEQGVGGDALEDGSQDFGYALGVLHHVPDTAAALASCTRLLKRGAPFLLYLYYRFDNRPAWFRGIWRVSEALRGAVSRLPDSAKPLLTDPLAALVYWPLARTARMVERLGGNPAAIPLSYYRDRSFFTMRTDSRDRFGTPLEQRFTKAEIAAMMHSAGLQDIRFSDGEPYWVAIGYKGI